MARRKTAKTPANFRSTPTNTPNPVDVGDEFDVTFSDLAQFEWMKYLPRNSAIIYSEYSGLYFIKELYNGYDKYYTLDRIANLARHRKGNVSAYGKHFKITKKSAERIADDLMRQARKLESLAQSYKLIASALYHGLEDIEDVVISDKMMKKEMENPF